MRSNQNEILLYTVAGRAAVKGPTAAGIPVDAIQKYIWATPVRPKCPNPVKLFQPRNGTGVQVVLAQNFQNF